MVSGYCVCTFPAIHVCSKCGVKLCNNCFKAHKCEVKAEQPELIEPVASQAAQTYTKKPGRPSKTK